MFKKPSSLLIVIVFLCQAAATASATKTHRGVNYFDTPSVSASPFELN